MALVRASQKYTNGRRVPFIGTDRSLVKDSMEGGFASAISVDGSLDQAFKGDVALPSSTLPYTRLSSRRLELVCAGLIVVGEPVLPCATTSSLISSPPPAAPAEDGLETQASEQPGSPAFSTSSTFDGGSSPVLPPLPAPTFNGRVVDLSTTPPSTSRSENSHYYTASWGSPYQQPPSTSGRTHYTHAHSHTLSSEPSEDSPLRHLEFHTPFLRPAPTFTRSLTDPEFVSNDGLISAAVLANRARRPAQGLTEDWIRQHTGGESGESNNWLSDDPGDSEHSSLSGSISGEGDWLGQDADPRTPTLKRFSESKDKTRKASSTLVHKRQQSTDTLKQEHFSDSPPPRMATTNEETGSSTEMAMSTPSEERPPPPPPKENLSWRAAMLPATPAVPVSTATPAPVPPRLKKKVPWKGKNIMVLLPWDDERGQKGKAPTPMSEKDVEAMLKEWEQLGYDTKGFNLGQTYGIDDEGGEVQSRSPWPQSVDLHRERDERSFQVAIPDRTEWDAYVSELAEAKLRALGVSFGDEDPPPTISPAVSNLSRQASMQYPPLPFSPPIPTSSATSSHLAHHQNPFSPALMPGAGMSTSQSSNPGSIASPASMHAHMQGKYNPRQSVSFASGDHPFGSPFQYPQQQSPSVWSPQQVLYQQGARGGSPALQNLGSIVSPTSPFSQDGYFPPGDVMFQMQQRQQALQNQLHQQQQMQLQAGARASPRLQEVREIDDEETLAPSKSPSKTPEARQIKHNPSASLQQEIDDAEYHLEEQFQRQLEHEDYSPHSDHGDHDARFGKEPEISHARNVSSEISGVASPRYAIDDSDHGPILHHPQPHSRGHSLSQRPFQDSEESAPESKPSLLNTLNSGKEFSDIETNPSNLGTPVQTLDSSSVAGHDRSLSTSSNPWVDSDPTFSENSAPRRPGHVSKPSMSKLNVGAKEFKFNPASPFQPSQTFNGGNSQQPIAAFSSFAPPLSETPSHFSVHSVNSSKNKINVTAPVFTPGQSEFSFSASGPSFRPDAPAFTPLNSTFSDSIGSIGSGGEGPRNSIFGSIDLSLLGITRPPINNKAIPIVRPDSSHSKIVEDEQEDEGGRITQGEGRIKRARGIKDDGDSVPLFATPSMPLGETSREQSPPKDSHNSGKPVDKENSAPLGDSDAEAPQIPAKSHSRNLSEQSLEQGKEFSPWEFQQQKQAEDFNAARPFISRRYGSGLPGYGFNASTSEENVSPVLEEDPTKPEPVTKAHKKNSLSATAKPFEFRPGAFNFTFGSDQPSQKAEPASDPEPEPAIATVVDPPPVSLSKKGGLGGLSSSRYARSPSPPAPSESPNFDMQPDDMPSFQIALPRADSPSDVLGDNEDREPTFEEIDAVMQHLNEVEKESSPRVTGTPPMWRPSLPAEQIQMPDPDISSPIRLQPHNLMRSDAPSPSPGRFRALPGETVPQRIFSREQDDPFVEDSPPVLPYPSPIHRLNQGSSVPGSDWGDVLSEAEEAKLQPRAQFFDNHVNELVGGILAERMDPLERTLETIQMSLQMMAARAPSSRRERRSISGALSDADDEEEDEEHVPRRSLSPRRDKKLEKIRAIVTEALATHQLSRPQTADRIPALAQDANVLRALEEMKEQFGQSMRLDFRAEDLRNVVEEAVEKRMPASPIPVVDEASVVKAAEKDAKIADLEERLRRAETTAEEEIQNRRSVEESALIKSAAAQAKIADLEERWSRADTSAEEEVKNRRSAEDRLAEVQRLLRISSEEEDRLRETMDEREVKIREIVDQSDAKVRAAEEARAKTTMKIALLEASLENSRKSHSESTNRITIMEGELRQARQETQHWEMESERALEAAKRHSEDAEQANETNKDLRRTIDSLRTQMEESIRVREGMRGKLMALQEDMALAAREISQENARRAKKEQELIARQEVLDARLQAEGRTRERLELEIERLEEGERQGMRAVSECKRLEALITDLKNESHAAQKDVMRYQREFEEARESGLSEVQRTRHYMQAEIESANNQVNVVREDLENQVSRLRAELDQVKLDADTTREKHEMLLEEANSSKKTLLDDMKLRHANEVEDLQTQHERQLGNTIEDAQRHEQHLLERLSLSSSKTEHLQDRVSHLEDKLEVAKSAANAAAKAARSASTSSSQPAPLQETISRAMELPEKISPQALRESIMVLQEQLQDREQTIEKLEQQVASLDPDSAVKISKRDDEILWLRELLAVRKSDLQDIVTALETDDYDAEQVKDAAIRLRANLQMEEQERERAMNGGSALNLPNIAASLRDAATPRVAQAVGPLAAAWGNWRKGRDSSVSDSGRPSSATPSRNSSTTQGFLNGLMTPPASNLRQSPLGGSNAGVQPTAFGSTGTRFTAQQLANRPRAMTPRAREKQPMRGSPRRDEVGQPATPPMMRKSSYDNDARAEDFSDAGFYDDDESAVDDSMFGVGR
ncbi:hypothetical protein D0Z07_9087 [Hyphodiscus hymeniophilus]|uniref:Myosin class II heavy chain n=1 Tax=Hyphodiscus hymeniophilus TaxID=353542 RepID=A0A9P6SJI7_9HELO|nr:hypothetical protein D0Z07_9087 [Hyphodiscus hymeniophilus]